MLKTNTNISNGQRTNPAIEFVQWPSSLSIDNSIDNKAIAIQTTRLAPNECNGDLTSPYQSFNLGQHVGDCAEQVQKNRISLQSLLPKNTKIQWLEQVHGNKVVEISKVSTQSITADAVVTREKNICLAIMTADCLPILLMSISGDEIAAIHGGWRPLAANIINNAVYKMKTPATDIVAWLGPCISKDVFEVGAEVKTSFTQQQKKFNSAFTAKANGKYLADLHEIAKLQLKDLGINQISTLPECTYSNTDKYYSYRKNSVTGRMATLISLF